MDYVISASYGNDSMAMVRWAYEQGLKNVVVAYCDTGWAAPAAPVQQADPVEQIGWADEFGNLFPMGAWKPAQRTWRDSHKTAWRPVFLHPPAAEVQRLRDALTAICAVADDREEGNYDTVPIHFIRSIARDATKGGK